jgi:hypothetical protein
MKIIAHVASPILRFITLDEFLPVDNNSMAFYAPAIAARYDFQAQGESQIASGVGFNSPIFQNGRFDYKGVDTPILSVDFQGSRILAICSTTEQTFAFLEDLIEFLVTTFEFRRPERPIDDLVSSATIVDFEQNIIAKITEVAKIHSMLRSYMGGLLEKATLEPQGLKFSGSVPFGTSSLNILYTLEERAGRPVGTQWFFSHAPFATDIHVEFLEKLETMLLGNKTPA